MLNIYITNTPLYAFCGGNVHLCIHCFGLGYLLVCYWGIHIISSRNKSLSGFQVFSIYVICKCLSWFVFWASCLFLVFTVGCSSFDLVPCVYLRFAAWACRRLCRKRKVHSQRAFPLYFCLVFWDFFTSFIHRELSFAHGFRWRTFDKRVKLKFRHWMFDELGIHAVWPKRS